jgi:hypothetical protein
MALPWLMIASMAAEAMDRQRKQSEARKNARAGMRAQYASDMGAPGYGWTAARTNKDIDGIEGTDYLSQLLPLLENQRKAEDEEVDE